MVINLSEKNSLVNNWISEIRDVNIQTDRMRFRRNLERIGEVAAYEISKTLPFVEKEVQTPRNLCLQSFPGTTSTRYHPAGRLTSSPGNVELFR